MWVKYDQKSVQKSVHKNGRKKKQHLYIAAQLHIYWSQSIIKAKWMSFSAGAIFRNCKILRISMCISSHSHFLDCSPFFGISKLNFALCFGNWMLCSRFVFGFTLISCGFHFPCCAPLQHIKNAATRNRSNGFACIGAQNYNAPDNAVE